MVRKHKCTGRWTNSIVLHCLIIEESYKDGRTRPLQSRNCIMHYSLKRHPSISNSKEIQWAG